MLCFNFFNLNFFTFHSNAYRYTNADTKILQFYSSSKKIVSHRFRIKQFQVFEICALYAKCLFTSMQKQYNTLKSGLFQKSKQTNFNNF